MATPLGIVASGASTAAGGGSILLADGTSHLLLADGSSHLLLAV